MTDAIEQAARIIHGCTGDEDGAPVAARALADEGLLAPAPLRQEWSTADDEIDAHTCCGYEDRAVIEAHAARCGYQIVHRWVTEWEGQS